jgi:hypothetical protein
MGYSGPEPFLGYRYDLGKGFPVASKALVFRYRAELQSGASTLLDSAAASVKVPDYLDR